MTGDQICNSSHVFRYSINCPEYEIWKKAFLRGGYSPYASSGRTLIEQSKFIYPTVNYYFFKDRQLFGYASILSIYDELSDQGYTSLPKPDESECGQMVSEKVYLTYFDVYLSQLM